MRTLVVGYGSIGERHARILKEDGHEVQVVSKRKDLPFKTFPDLSNALLNQRPEYVVISNLTSEHAQSIQVLIQKKYSGFLLIEKPLARFARELPLDAPNAKTYVGYNLRLHPLFQKLHDYLRAQRVLSIRSYCGSYLPDWRPDDYRKASSARKEWGGGALRVLSHDLDYTCWLGGRPKKVLGWATKTSRLEIDCEDTAVAQWLTESGATATVEVNFTDRIHQRHITVVTENDTYFVDLIKGTLRTKSLEESAQPERDTTYRLMHQSVQKGDPRLCTWADGLMVQKLIDAIEKSQERGEWQVLT